MPKSNKEQSPPQFGERAKGRPSRIPVSGQGNILGVQGKDPNYVYRFVKDEGARVEMFKRAYWEVVDSKDVVVDSTAAVDLGSTVTVVGNRRENQKLVLMRIKKEYYDEDADAKQDGIDKTEQSLREQAEGEDKYGKISIK